MQYVIVKNVFDILFLWVNRLINNYLVWAAVMEIFKSTPVPVR